MEAHTPPSTLTNITPLSARRVTRSRSRTFPTATTRRSIAWPETVTVNAPLEEDGTLELGELRLGAGAATTTVVATKALVDNKAGQATAVVTLDLPTPAVATSLDGAHPFLVLGSGAVLNTTMATLNGLLMLRDLKETLFTHSLVAL